MIGDQKVSLTTRPAGAARWARAGDAVSRASEAASARATHLIARTFTRRPISTHPRRRRVVDDLPDDLPHVLPILLRRAELPAVDHRLQRRGVAGVRRIHRAE